MKRLITTFFIFQVFSLSSIYSQVDVLADVYHVCDGSESGSIEVNIIGGIPPFTLTLGTLNATETELIPYSVIEGVMVSALFENIPPDDYHLRVEDDECNIAKMHVEITESDLKIENEEIINPTCDGGGSIAISGFSGGVSPYYVLWNTGSTDLQISDLNAGFYSVTVSDLHECSIVKDFSLLNPESPVDVVINENIGSCVNLDNGTLDVSIGSLLGNNLSFNWSTSLISLQSSLGNVYTFNGNSLSSGTYSVEVIDNETDCVSEFSFYIPEIESQGDLQLVLANLDISYDCGLRNGASINGLKIIDGVPPYSIHWFQTGTSDLDLINVSSGNYFLEIRDYCDNSIIENFIIDVEEVCLEVSANMILPCNEQGTGSVELEILNGTSPYDISWDNGSSALEIKDLEIGNYSVTITDSNGLVFNETFNITTAMQAPLSLHFNILSPDIESTSFKEGTLEISATGGSGNYSGIGPNNASNVIGVHNNLQGGWIPTYTGPEKNMHLISIEDECNNKLKKEIMIPYDDIDSDGCSPYNPYQFSFKKDNCDDEVFFQIYNLDDNPPSIVNATFIWSDGTYDVDVDKSYPPAENLAVQSLVTEFSSDGIPIGACLSNWYSFNECNDFYNLKLTEKCDAIVANLLTPTNLEVRSLFCYSDGVEHIGFESRRTIEESSDLFVDVYPYTKSFPDAVFRTPCFISNRSLEEIDEVADCSEFKISLAKFGCDQDEFFLNAKAVNKFNIPQYATFFWSDGFTENGVESSRYFLNEDLSVRARVLNVWTDFANSEDISCDKVLLVANNSCYESNSIHISWGSETNAEINWFDGSTSIIENGQCIDCDLIEGPSNFSMIKEVENTYLGAPCTTIDYFDNEEIQCLEFLHPDIDITFLTGISKRCEYNSPAPAQQFENGDVKIDLELNGYDGDYDLKIVGSGETSFDVLEHPVSANRLGASLITVEFTSESGCITTIEDYFGGRLRDHPRLLAEEFCFEEGESKLVLDIPDDFSENATIIWPFQSDLDNTIINNGNVVSGETEWEIPSAGKYTWDYNLNSDNIKYRESFTFSEQNTPRDYILTVGTDSGIAGCDNFDCEGNMTSRVKFKYTPISKTNICLGGQFENCYGFKRLVHPNSQVLELPHSKPGCTYCYYQFGIEGNDNGLPVMLEACEDVIPEDGNSGNENCIVIERSLGNSCNDFSLKLKSTCTGTFDYRMFDGPIGICNENAWNEGFFDNDNSDVGVSIEANVDKSLIFQNLEGPIHTLMVKFEDQYYCYEVICDPFNCVPNLELEFVSGDCDEFTVRYCTDCPGKLFIRLFNESTSTCDAEFWNSAIDINNNNVGVGHDVIIGCESIGGNWSSEPGDHTLMYRIGNEYACLPIDCDNFDDPEDDDGCNVYLNPEGGGNDTSSVTFTQIASDYPNLFYVNSNNNVLFQVLGVTKSNFTYTTTNWQGEEGGGNYGGTNLSYFYTQPGLKDFGGLKAEVGQKRNVGRSKVRVNFTNSFTTQPIVIAMANSVRSSKPSVSRVTNVTMDGFDLQIQTEKGDLISNVEEDISFIAIETGLGSINGRDLFVGRTGNVVDENGFNLQYPIEFEGNPILLGATQTANDADPLSFHVTSLSSTNATLMLQEEDYMGSGVLHAPEVVGYFILESIEDCDENNEDETETESSKIGGKVWFEPWSGGDYGLYNEGIDSVLSEITVNLLHDDESSVLDSNGNPMITSTDANGDYSFDQLSSGTYKVEFINSDQYSQFIDWDAGDDLIDSDVVDVNQDSGKTNSITLEEFEENLSIYCGFHTPALQDNGQSTSRSDGEISILCYPNPSRKMINVKTINISEKIKVQIFSSDGKLIISDTYKAGHIQIDLSKLNSGVYLLNLDNNEIHYSTRISKI
jgi:hypothetical protein